MVKQTLLRLTRDLGLHWNGQRRRRTKQTAVQQIELLEHRQLLTNTVTANYATPGGTHQLSITLTNPSPVDLTVDPADANVAQFHIEILGPVGLILPPGSHTAPRVELGGEDLDLDGVVDGGEDVINASLQPTPDGILQPVLAFDVLTLTNPGDGASVRAKFEGDVSLALGANRTSTLPIVVRRSAADTSGILVTTIAVTTDTIGPAITSISAVTSPRSTAVTSVTVTFDSAINASTFTAADVTLLRNGIDVGPSLTITPAGGNSYTIGSLADDTAADGDYDLTVSAAGVMDLVGNSGSGSVTRSWTKTSPSSPVLEVADDSGRESDDGITNQLTNLTFTGTADGATSVQVRLTLSGGGATTNNAVLNGSSYTAEFTGPLAEGTYTVEALVSDGVTSVTSAASSLTLDATAPAQLTALDLTTATDTKGPQISVDDNLTRTATPTFTFTGAETDAAVTLVRDSVDNTVSTPTSGNTVSSITSSTTTAGVHSFAVFQTDIAGNSSTTSSSLNVAIDTTNPVVSNPTLTSALASNLKVPITTETLPTIQANVTDQTFSGFTNLTRVELVNKANGSVLRTTDAAIVANNVGQQLQLTPTTALTPGQYTVFVRATDAAGNTANSSDFTFFISQPGLTTADAPSTPVFSETYFLGSTVKQNAGTSTNIILVDRPIPVGFTARISGTRYVVQASVAVGNNTQLTLDQNLTAAVTANVTTVSWLRPWTQTFDRTTQTIWFTDEDGHRLGQFDPATGLTKLYEIGLPDGSGLPTATDPHGVIFDFDSHITPRVWFVYRNNAGDNDTPLPPDNNETGRVSYLDLATGELLTFDFTGLTKSDGSPLATHTHAVFIDARGHLWLSAEDSATLIELDFDQQFNGTLSSSINARTGRIITHELPESLGDQASGAAHDVTPHGIATVVDERTGEQYIYFTDENLTSTGRMYLLKPGRPANGSDPGIADQWIQWDIDAALAAEEGPISGFRLSGDTSTSHSHFLAIDDNETPGIPEDDSVIVADPGGLQQRGSAGVIRRFQVNDVIAALQAGTDLPATARVETVRISKIPGADATQTFAATQVPFSDREGNVFFVDGLGSIGRFNFDDPLLDPNPGSTADTSDIQAPVTSFLATSAPNLLGITMTSSAAPLQLISTTIVPLGMAGRDDRSQGNGVDQYEVAMPSQRTRSDGAFRGFLNTANVVSGSLAQSDYLSTTIFAETARRQMSVVEDPTEMPTGAIVEGRMAFQVARNGSLIMTSREHGQLLDQQRNLSRDRILAGDTASEILIDGDSSAVTASNGNVHVFGKNQIGGLVEYRFNGTSWSTFAYPAPATGVLVSEPAAFIDEQGNVGALINRNDGHLLLYRNAGATPTDLTGLAGGGAPIIFASVGIVEDPDADILFVYGSDQSGSVVEYSFSTTTPIPIAVTAGTIMVTARPAGQTIRDTQVFQSLNAVATGGTRHIFGTDGHSRLVHLEVTSGTLNAFAENVTELTKATATGYFESFQREFAARVNPELSVLIDPNDGTLFVYGTNGLDLVEFTRSETTWTAADLTNDIMKGVGDRIPANKVFGAPSAYVTAAGDRHVFQINADGEVIEYAFRKASDHFNTQNINFLASGKSYTSLQDLNVNVAPALSIPATPQNVILGGPAALVAADANVFDPDSPDFETGQLIVRTINSSDGDLLSIRSQTLDSGDVISVSAGTVSFNGVLFGSFAGGSGSTPLTVTFDSSTSQDAVKALLQSLEFSASVASSIGVRFVEFELTDNAGGRSNRATQQVTVDDTDPDTNPLIHPLL